MDHLKITLSLCYDNSKTWYAYFTTECACTQGNYIIGKAPAFDEAIEDQIQTQDDKHYPKKTQSLPLASYQLDLQNSSEKLSW